jgi:hypothetical protein
MAENGRKSTGIYRLSSVVRVFSHSPDPKQSFHGPTALKRIRSFRPRKKFPTGPVLA